MINKFCKKPLWECSKTLSAVAQGLAPAETVIKGAKLVYLLPDGNGAITDAEIDAKIGPRTKVAAVAHVWPSPRAASPTSAGQTTASARTRRSSMRRGSTSRQGSSTGTSTWNRP